MNDEVRIALRGEIDVQVSKDLREKLTSGATRAAGGRLVIDLADVTFLDSSGISAFIAALRTAQMAGGEVRVVNPSPTVLRTFEITGLVEHFGMEQA